MHKFAQSSLFKSEGRIYPQFSGVQSVCLDAAVQVYLFGKPVFSLGCDGSRKYSGIAKDERVMGIPAEILPEICAAVPVITGAPESG